MFCEKCGAKNEDSAKFCEKCGNKLEQKQKTSQKKQENEYLEKFKSLPKRTKIISGVVLVVAVIAIIVLCILLNNPIKKVEDGLAKYYDNYTENNNQELVLIGKVLKNNKGDEKTLKKIKETTNKIVDKWVKNFNIEYKDEDALENAYKRVSGSIKGIYTYFNGLEYMLDYKTYSDKETELNQLYTSKYYYLNGLEYEEKENEYYAYYNYQKVIENDCYYKKAQEYISNFVKDEMESYKKEIEDILKIDETSTNEEILNNYLEQIKYMNSNKIVNNIDLSATEEYQKMYKDISSKVLEYAKKIITDLEKENDYNQIVKLLKNALQYISKESDSYKELEELKKQYEDKLPDSLLDKYRVSYNGAKYSSYKKTINEKEYDSYISFSFKGETQNIVYRLNGDYKKFKTTIVRGENWDKSFSGYFVIYGDGKELYKSDTITKSGDLKDSIEIDVTGVDDLKIEFVTTSKASGWDSFYIYLVEPYLYK